MLQPNQAAAVLQACNLEAETFVSIVKCLPKGLQSLDISGNPCGARLGAPTGAHTCVVLYPSMAGACPGNPCGARLGTL